MTETVAHRLAPVPGAGGTWCLVRDGSLSVWHVAPGTGTGTLAPSVVCQVPRTVPAHWHMP